MKILVPVKQVASLDEDFALGDDGSVAADELEWQLNEWDGFSLEAALQLNEGEDREVVVVTVGDEQAEEGLLACMAKGADRAIRVWDESLQGADALAVAGVLAAVARAEQPELILCGVQSSDAAGAATGIALAGLLDLAHVAVVTEIERDGERLTVQRELRGRHHRAAADLAAVSADRADRDQRATLRHAARNQASACQAADRLRTGRARARPGRRGGERRLRARSACAGTSRERARRCCRDRLPMSPRGSPRSSRRR